VTCVLNGNYQAVLSGPVFQGYFGSSLAIAIAGGTLGYYMLQIDSSTNVRILIESPCLQVDPFECDEVLSLSVADQQSKCNHFL
jgi:hypothetical protein